ncbi:hypothetical protein LPH52_00110 [Xylella taiwanensis]|uniref:hypothetical protein n=1 Tax=Xylella taiwanensis TaxID=1444770 RepID=UPI001E5C21ED|nr:hypothetical protein [Xylella taiwanensis]MCD8455290.1 hypothetical protein [Xylella taiwanensis]MCD8459834.1 hypothetical protein [Xylella taiwanensis]MCD8464337.1 hypothetical protein [Xylella taiwanensis]MCD8468102.1 hypothetical protein [Xylella taiwanensis]MCD8469557.1 hypothetical protein [Xylella taiwanensis]
MTRFQPFGVDTATLQHRRRYCRANITPRLHTAKRLSPADLNVLWKDFAHAGALLVSFISDLKAV